MREVCQKLTAQCTVLAVHLMEKAQRVNMIRAHQQATCFYCCIALIGVSNTPTGKFSSIPAIRKGTIALRETIRK